MLILVKQAKSIGVIVLIVALAWGAAKFYNEANSLKEINSKNESQITNLKQQNGALQESLSELKKLTATNSELEIKLNNFKRTNNELKKTVDNLIADNNSLRGTVEKAVQAGVSKPPRVGITPSFTVASRGVTDRNFRLNLTNLSQGSYQHHREDISFNINDRSKWKNVGTWFVTRYTATVEECDANPSITADNKLVTPGFTVAVDPAHWKYGTIFYFDGLGFGVAADCGGAVKGKKRADYLVASKKFSNILDNYRRVWVVYVPK